MQIKLALVLLLLASVPVMLVSAQDGDGDVPVPEDQEAGGQAGGEGETVTATDDESVIIDDIPTFGPSPDVSTTVIFPNHKTLRFPAAGIVTAVIALRNSGVKKYTISNVEGSLRHPQDFRYHVQDFYNVTYGVTLEANQETTLLYKFKIHDAFEPRDFGFQLNVNYTDEDAVEFTDALFNSTVSIVDSEESFDGKQLFSYIAVGAVGLLAFVFFKQSSAPQVQQQQQQRKIETGTSSNATNEWTSNMNLPGPARSPRAKKVTSS